MKIFVDNLLVLSQGSVVVKKDSEIKFGVDDSHELVMRLLYSDDKNVSIEVENNGNGLIFKCMNFGVNDSSRGLKFPVNILDEEDGSHILIQFVIVGIGESRVLHYTWYKDRATSINKSVVEEEL